MEDKYKDLPRYKFEEREEFVDGVSRGKVYEFKIRSEDSSYYLWKFSMTLEELQLLKNTINLLTILK